MSGGSLKFILRYIKKQLVSVIMVLLFSAITALIGIAAPFLIGHAVDLLILDATDFSAVFNYVIILVMLAALELVFTYLLGKTSYKIANRITFEMRRDAYKTLSKLPLGFYDTSHHGDIMSRFTNDTVAIADGLVELIINIFGGIITITGTLIVMFYLNVSVTVCVVLITFITFITASIMTKLSSRYYIKQQQLTGELGGLTEEMIDSIKTIKAYDYEDKCKKNFNDINSKLEMVARKANFISALSNPTTRFINYIAYIAIGVIGGTLAALSPGVISSFIIYSNQFAKPFNQITAVISQISMAFSALTRINILINKTIEPSDSINAITMEQHPHNVEFENASFSYNPEKPLIENFSLMVEKGKKVAIVGPTGAGKTTLVNLILRFYEINGGSIKIDGVDIKKYTKKSLRQNISMVLQETWLKDGTISQNISYGNPQASLDDIVDAAKKAGAHSFIMRMKNGYNTVISSKGDSISSGQKQLLTIARAMLIKSSILILDEATSNVDTRTELRIRKAFSSLLVNKTSFIIAHRLSTIENCDIIIVMNHGHIVEQGSHQELIQKAGFYKKLWDSQFYGNGAD